MSVSLYSFSFRHYSAGTGGQVETAVKAVHEQQLARWTQLTDNLPILKTSKLHFYKIQLRAAQTFPK